MILQYLALRSGIKVNVTETIKIPLIKHIESAPELAITVLAHAQVYKKTDDFDIISIEKLFQVFTDIQRLWLIENNQAIQQKAPHLDRETLVKLNSGLNDVLLPLQNTFIGCLKHTYHGENDIASCLEENELLSRLFKNDFLFDYDQITQGNANPTHDEIYRIWASFLSFRNYVVLRVKVYLVLFSTYQRVGEKSSRLRLGYFSDRMVNELGVYLKYFKAVQGIFMKEHKPDEDFHSRRDCTKAPGEIGQGVSCNFKMCKLSSEECRVKVAVFQKEHIQGASRFETETKDPFEAGKIFASKTAHNFFEQYHMDMDEILRDSWRRRMAKLYDVFTALKDATLIQNRRFINDCLKQKFSFKPKPNQTKNVNTAKSQIEGLKAKREQSQKENQFVKVTNYREEL